MGTWQLGFIALFFVHYLPLDNPLIIVAALTTVILKIHTPEEMYMHKTEEIDVV